MSQNILTALWSSQNDSHETDTVMEHGMYTVTMKNSSCRAKVRSTWRQEYSPARNKIFNVIELSKCTHIMFHGLLKLEQKSFVICVGGI